MRKQKPMRRAAGVLLPVSALPSPHGIGTFGKAAYEFADFLQAAGQKYWQVLPLGPTGFGDSPYQSFSAFAGNPYYIDLDLLAEQGLLTPREINDLPWGDDPAQADYGVLYQNRWAALQKAFARSDWENAPAYAQFRAAHGDWLPGYGAFMAQKTGLPEAFWGFCQYHFFRQWDALKRYCNERDISVIGDIPIYVSPDSADLRDHPELFQLDAGGKMTAVAGVPPDMFSETGQLWGNPLYDWDAMERDGFQWWKDRVRHSLLWYDVLRIDHFIGVVNYYAIPAGETSAVNGAWVKGPGLKLLAAINEALGDKRIIAEDLGVVTPGVIRARDRAGYPGMSLLTFAFTGDGTHPYLPCNLTPNMVAYGGTHDNETLRGYFEHRPRKELRYAREYLRARRNADIPWELIRAGYGSCAALAVFQMQDYLGLGNEARFNTPSTLGGRNWRWRLVPGQADAALAERLRSLCATYGR
jgi:4-alpha-glucanotransferase